MQEPVTKTTESSLQPERNSLFSRWWFWVILLCLIAGGAFCCLEKAAESGNFFSCQVGL